MATEKQKIAKVIKPYLSGNALVDKSEINKSPLTIEPSMPPTENKVAAA